MKQTHKILIESSVIEDPALTGVGYFTRYLSDSLDKVAAKNSDSIGYFWINFLNKKGPLSQIIQTAHATGRLHKIRWIPQRVYAKLVYAKLAPPLVLPKSDWVLFPNFYIWPIASKAKRAVVIHDIGYLIYPEYVEDKNRLFLEKVVAQSVKQADLVISISKFTSQELSEKFDVSRDKMLTIEIPIDESQFVRAESKDRNYLGKRYKINKPYILTFGTIEPRKNIDMMVEAYCRLPKNIRDKYSLVLAGRWGWKVDVLRTKIEELQSAGYDIITPGYIEHDDRSTFYYNASYYVITTHYEGFGMPLLEALYCGVPSVAVDIPVLHEVAGDACLWAGKTVDDITHKLEKIMTDKSLAHHYAKAGILQAQKFSWDKTAQKVYDRLTKVNQ